MEEKPLRVEDSGALMRWERLTDAQETEEDGESSRSVKSLRPSAFDEYIGQTTIKQNVSVACRAARARAEALDHVLLHGPPGLGKTSLARVLAKELGVEFAATSGPVLERPGDLASMLTSLQSGQVLFIDEIHRLPRVVEEVLYSAMEDFQLDIMIGQGSSARSVRVPLKPFTLVGATTRSGMLTSPLRDRFGMVLRLQFYHESDLAAIVMRSAGILEMRVDEDAALEIGKRSRGTPRIANRLLKRIRDYAEDGGHAVVDYRLVNFALEKLEIDSRGLDAMDRQILSTMIDSFDGGPVGIESLAAAIGEERATLEDVYEPFLIQSGFVVRTRVGRRAGRLAYELLGRTMPVSTDDPTSQQSLFSAAGSGDGSEQ